MSKVATTEQALPCTVSTSPAETSALWISWNTHRRTTGLCTAWEIPLHVIHSRRAGVSRPVDQALQTIALLRRSRPRVLFVQNPSLALTTLALLVRWRFGYFLVVDAHNEGVRPFARPGRFVGWLTRRLLRGADATIVTNAAMARDVEAAGGRPLVLPDRLPEPELSQKHTGKDEIPHVAVISSFMSDEPVDALLEAAAMLPGVRFALTGDARRFSRKHIDLPPNVRLTGYLPERAFWRLLSQAPVICDLTLKPDCLVCGAYEALALGKPMVLSDNPPTREIFGAAAVLTNNQPEDIARAVKTAIERRDALAATARALRDGYAMPWHARAAIAWDAIHASAMVARRGLI